MKGMKMLKTERIAMIALAVIVILFAVLALANNCSRGQSSAAVPDPRLVAAANDTLSLDSTKTDTLSRDTVKETQKTKKKKRKKKQSATRQGSAPAPQRHHRSEPVSQ